MIRVHFLINKLDIEHIIALEGKKAMKIGKKGESDVKCGKFQLLGTVMA